MGKREVGGYEFFYQGWKENNPTRENCRFGATREDLFPADRDVTLYVTFLKKMGLSKQRMEECNALLKNYSAVDKIDQMLLGWDLSYRSWSWWHASTRHAKAIAMSMVYSLYLQCAKGTVDPEWKVTSVSGPRFWQRISLQMVQYKCSNLHYPGDKKRCARILR
jgi:hypothetical protein